MAILCNKWKFTILLCNREEGRAVKFESRGSYFDSVIFVALLLCRLFSQKLSEQRNITVRRLRMYLNSNTTQLTRTSEKLAPKC